ncbi:MAG: FMN-binding protein [Bacillota bacterium]|nr:FMN-binding protein [Bacillota bacterium]
MRNILRLSLTLVVVGVVSAALLTGMYNLTTPIIAERKEAEYRESLNCCFPDFDTFETVEIEEDKFDLLYDENGDLIGIMATAVQQGYDGDITYNLAFDGEGKIIDIIIISHTETPGVGEVITTDDFQQQFMGKSYEDPLTAGEDVDTVSGATISTSSMIGSIRRVTGVVAENFLGVESEEIDINSVPDGVYNGSAPGAGGPITVEVEISGGEITRIDILEQNETPTYYIESYPVIPEQIIANQNLDVDTKTGATISAEGIINAVRDALSGALEDGS